MTETTTDELRKLLERARPRDWFISKTTGPVRICEPDDADPQHPWIVANLIHGPAQSRAALIVAAVNALPGLLDQLSSCKQENERLTGVLVEIGKSDRFEGERLVSAHYRAGRGFAAGLARQALTPKESGDE